MNKIVEFLTSKRLQSLYWRSGCMFLVAFINLVVENLSGFGLSGQWLVFSGLILGEITKAISNLSQQKEA